MANSMLFFHTTGSIAVTTKALTFGRKDASTTNYFLRGSLHEVRVYDVSLAPNEIDKLRTTWNSVTAIVDDRVENIARYPNPFQTDFYLKVEDEVIQAIKVFKANGQSVGFTVNVLDGFLKETPENQSVGLLIIKIQTAHGVYHFKMIHQL